jgi:phosphoenolpyruvate carboxykinase (GTP)
MIGRVKGEAGAVDTPIGALPRPEDLDLAGVELSEEAIDKLFGFHRHGWQEEFGGIGEFLAGFGPRMPEALRAEQQRIAAALQGWVERVASP